MTAITQEDVLALLGKAPADVAGELQAFSDTARVLSSSRPRLIEDHPQQWVGLHAGRVEVFGKTLNSVLAQLRERGLPQSETLVRFIDREERTLIL